MDSFVNVCDQLVMEYNRKRVVDNRRSEDILFNYNQLSDSEKTMWVLEARNVIEKNKHMGYVSFAVQLFLQINLQEDILIYLKKYPKRKKNDWNEILLSRLNNNKYFPLSNETEIIELVLPTMHVMGRFQFFMRFIYMNKHFSLNHCN